MNAPHPPGAQKEILGFSPQFSVHPCADDQILLLSEARSFRLKGRLYGALAPLLDGSRNEAEIVEGLAAKASPQNVLQALKNLRERGYVRPHLAKPIAQQSLWIEWEREPEEVVAALAAWPLAVLAMGQTPATNETAAGELSALLEDGGFPVVRKEDARLVVVLVDDFLSAGLEQLNRQQRAGMQSWVLFKPAGREAWLGPRFDPTSPRCWHCLSRHMLEHRPGDALVQGKSETLRPGRGMQRATLELARAQAVLALTRMALGEADLEDQLLTLDSLNGCLTRHYVRLNPCCPVCDSPSGDAPVPHLEQLAKEERLASKDGGWRVLSTEEARFRLKRLVSPVTGLVRELSDRSRDLGLPVVTAMQTHPKSVSLADNRLIGRPGAAGGKGGTVAQAEVSCMAEALERYCTVFTGREPRRRATLAELGETALDPRDLLLFSEAQYRGRAAWNARADDFNKVPEPFEVEEAIEWSPIYRLRDGAKRWIPTRYCFIGYRDHEGRSDRKFCVADSNGCASGAVLSEAILQGLLELVERDSCALFWYNRIERPEIDLDQFDDPFIARTRAHYAAAGRSLYALDLRSDIAVPVVMAVSTNADGRMIHVGLGAHPEVSVAVSRAIAEVNQVAQWHSGVSEEDYLESDRPIYAWYQEASLENQPYLQPAARKKTVKADFPSLCEPGVGAALKATSDLLQQAGLEPLAMDVSWPGLDFACARVVVPGLRHFWARFAPGRLYDIPLQLGWVQRPTKEEDLNPIAFLL